MKWRRVQVDPYKAMRRRMIRETELALLAGLQHAERMPRIPTMEVGIGMFRPDFAARFWAETLGMEPEELARLEAATEPDRIEV